MAAIHKRRTRGGEVVWELTHGTGRNRQRMIAGRTKEEAQEVLKQFERQLARHGQAPRNSSLLAVVGEYMTYLATNRRKSTVKRYDHALRNFLNTFLFPIHPDVTQLRQIRPNHLEEYKQRRLTGEIIRPDEPEKRAHDEALRALRGRPIGSAKERAKFGTLGRKPVQLKVTTRTINYELQVLDTFFRWTIKRNYLFINPASDVERFRLPKRVVPKFLTSEELKRLFAVCSATERRLFAAILLSGMRKGEAEHLTWSDINFEMGVIFIQPKADWRPKSDDRLIPLSPTLRRILEEQYTKRLSETLVFPNHAGQRDTHILEKFRSICRKAGIRRSTVHALRHSFGAHLRMAGANLADIADLLGHKDLATTQIYAKVQQEHLRRVIGRITPLVDEAEELLDSPKALPADPEK